MISRKLVFRQPHISVQPPDLAIALLRDTVPVETSNLTIGNKTVQREIPYVRVRDSEQLQSIHIGRNKTVFIIRHDDRVERRCYQIQQIILASLTRLPNPPGFARNFSTSVCDPIGALAEDAPTSVSTTQPDTL